MDEDLIPSLEILIQLIKNSDCPATLSHISTIYTRTTSKISIWKHYGLSFSEFLRKFPLNFSLIQEGIITLVSEEINVDVIMKQWNTHESEQDLLSKHYNMKLECYKLPENIEISIVNKAVDTNNWIQKYIYDNQINIVALDTETTITGSLDKPSIVQLGVGLQSKPEGTVVPSNYYCLIIQLSLLEDDNLPNMLIKLLTDPHIIKQGVSIVKSDINMLQLASIEKFTANGIIDLGLFAEMLFRYEYSLQNEYVAIFHDRSKKHIGSYGLRDLTGIILEEFLSDKGCSDIKMTNWKCKVLNRDQIEYAVSDVCVALDICL